ncbi:hypothetical protein Rsub_06594 [Raphidocelis subcapitata]|uniref:Uncharacterized protein n=1 Tax=Raphidocelis subcapitata TaxID=307507 RepID=A0A2V0P0R6_9CHLO|nr:hypothetical protein Rsub_06594 [Raphidocelis subcapitata]|eukprot:GBF93461.1 hypothetical protein Rsub_06594 [Raphidocelis subcapitata]
MEMEMLTATILMAYMFLGGLAELVSDAMSTVTGTANVLETCAKRFGAGAAFDMWRANGGFAAWLLDALSPDRLASALRKASINKSAQTRITRLAAEARAKTTDAIAAAAAATSAPIRKAPRRAAAQQSRALQVVSKEATAAEARLALLNALAAVFGGVAGAFTALGLQLPADATTAADGSNDAAAVAAVLGAAQAAVAAAAAAAAAAALSTAATKTAPQPGAARAQRRVQRKSELARTPATAPRPLKRSAATLDLGASFTTPSPTAAVDTAMAEVDALRSYRTGYRARKPSNPKASPVSSASPICLPPPPAALRPARVTAPRPKAAAAPRPALSDAAAAEVFCSLGAAAGLLQLRADEPEAGSLEALMAARVEAAAAAAAQPVSGRGRPIRLSARMAEAKQQQQQQQQEEDEEEEEQPQPQPQPQRRQRRQQQPEPLKVRGGGVAKSPARRDGQRLSAESAESATVRVVARATAKRTLPKF